MEPGIQQSKFGMRQRAFAGTAIGVATDDDVFDANVDNCVVDYGHD
jgi:hypothetical protein